MATVTGGLRRNVARHFTGRHAAVVAGRTSPSANASMAEFRATERLGGMASFATHLGRHVSLWFHNIAFRQTQAAGMATGAVLGCAFEYAAHMTGFTARRQVLTRQRKTGLQMVKIAHRALGVQGHRASDENKGCQPLEDTAKQARNVRFHDKNPISFVHTQLPTPYPGMAGTISLKETRLSVDTPD